MTNHLYHQVFKKIEESTSIIRWKGLTTCLPIDCSCCWSNSSTLANNLLFSSWSSSIFLYNSDSLLLDPLINSSRMWFSELTSKLGFNAAVSWLTLLGLLNFSSKSDFSCLLASLYFSFSVSSAFSAPRTKSSFSREFNLDSTVRKSLINAISSDCMRLVFFSVSQLWLT